MTDEKENAPRMRSGLTSFSNAEQIREQAELKAEAVSLPDPDTMMREEIVQMFQEMKVRQIEAELQNEQLQSRLEEYADRDVFPAKLSGNTASLASTNKTLGRNEEKKARPEANFINRLEAIINGIPDVLAIQLPDHTIERYNQAGYEMLGMTPEEVSGRKCYELIGRDRECSECTTRKALQSGRLEKAEKYIPEWGLYLDCSSNPVFDEEGNLVQVIEQLRDITAAKEQEKKLQESEERLDLAMMVKNEGIWDWNPVSGEAVFDERYYTMAGYAPNEFPGNFTAWAKRVHPDDLPNADAAIKNYLSGRQERFDTEFRFRHKNGSWLWIRGQGKIVKRDENGAPLRMIGTHTDITERKRAEHELRESEKKYRFMTEQMNDVVWTTDPDMRITYISPSDERILGFTPEERMEHALVDMLTPSSQEKAMELISREYAIEAAGGADPHRSVSIELEYRHKDGTTRWLETLATGIRDDAGRLAGLHGVSRDITERKKAMEALSRQLRFEQAAATASKCLLSAEICEARVTDALTPLLEASGASRVYIFENFNDPDDGLCMRQVFEVCAPGVPPEIDNLLLQRLPYSQGFQRWREMLSQGSAIHGDVRDFPYKEREVLESHEIVSILALPIFVDGKWWGFIGFDETRRPCNWVDMELAMLRTLAEMFGGFFARKQAGDALAASERRFREILQGAATVAVQGYAVDGTVRYWNRASETFYGYSAEEALGRNLLDLIIPPGKRDEVRNEMRYMAQTGKAAPASELVLMRKDGSHITVYSSHALVQVPGQDTELFCIDIDLTDRLRAEKEKEKLQAQLNHAQKMDSVGRLAGGVAHDFNNMLSIINGYAEMSIDMLDPADPLYGNIQEIRTAGKRSGDIVRQLLTFARKQRVVPQQIDLNDTISGMLKLLRRLIGENIDLNWYPGSSLWPVKIDTAQVDQVMANFAVNARDAIADVGKLIIETKNVVMDEEYCKAYPYFIPGQYVMLGVSDNGCGMEKEIRENMFEPFFTTKETGKGTGLGLSTVYGIVKQNNGFINVYSEPGEGTTFKIYLPRHDAEKSISEGPEKTTERLSAGSGTILLVEDESAILWMARRMLEKLGYTVLAAERPGQALHIAEKYKGTINLLITDVVMPEMNGRDLAARLRVGKPGIKTLYMSGYTADVIAHHGVLDEGVLFIQKPFSTRDLSEKVREAIAQKQDHVTGPGLSI